MNTVHISPEPLRVLLQAQKIATMPQLKSALGTSVDGTVFRKLSTLTYRTSYSHRGAITRSTPLPITMPTACGLTTVSIFPSAALFWIRLQYL